MNKLFAAAALAAASYATTLSQVVDENADEYGPVDDTYCCNVYAGKNFTGSEVKICADRYATDAGYDYFKQTARSLALLDGSEGSIDNTIESFKCGSNVAASFCAGVYEYNSNVDDHEYPFSCHGGGAIYQSQRGEQVLSDWSARNIASAIILEAFDAPPPVLDFADCKATVFEYPACKTKLTTDPQDGPDTGGKKFIVEDGIDSYSARLMAMFWEDEVSFEIKSIWLPGESELEVYSSMSWRDGDNPGQIIKNHFNQKPLDLDFTHHSCICFELEKSYSGQTPEIYDIQSFSYTQEARLVVEQ